MKIAHLADTHIKLLKQHDNYRIVFGELYEFLKKETPDCIVHCGDLFHNKTQLSPEAVSLAADFLNSLSAIAPVVLIAGNHDGNLKNTDREDAISPVYKALNNPNIKYLKNSGEYEFNDEVTFNVLSIFDRDNWKAPSNKNKINIALYHGAIEGARTDTGWAMKDTDDDLNIFEDFDFAFLGDIHKRQFFGYKAHSGITRELRPTIAYCGSTIQQNFGEESSKGLLLWDIKSKSKWNVQPVDFKNPHPFITVDFNKETDFTKYPTGAHFRIILDKFYESVEIEELKSRISRDSSPASIIVVDKHSKEVENSIDEGITAKLNLRDNNVQQELIKDFLKEEGITEKFLQEILDINTKYNLEAEITDDVARNVKWSLQKFAWDNLFNYKEENTIDFSELSGIVGIFGKNYSGKSSIIDGLLYTLFNSTSKKIRKNFDVVNERKKRGKGSVCIGVGENKNLLITRETEKSTKKSKGKIVEEGKTELNFEILAGASILPFNGNDRMETDKNIRREIGTVEDFCNTSLSTQHGSLEFINEGSTKRKEILANFLDLQLFERKHKPANQYANELKSLIKKLQGKDYEKLIGEIRGKLLLAENELERSKDSIISFKEKIDNARERIAKITSNLAKVEGGIDIERVTWEKKNFEKQFAELEMGFKSKTEEMQAQEDLIKKIKAVLDRINVEDLKKTQEASKKVLKDIDSILYEKKLKMNSLAIHKKSAGILEQAACGVDQFRECSFKKDALSSLEEISIVELALKQIEEKEYSLKQDYVKLDMEKTNEYLDKYEKLKEKLNEASRKSSVLLKETLPHYETKALLQKKIEEKEALVSKYEENKELYDNTQALSREKGKEQLNIVSYENALGMLEKGHLEIVSKIASLNQQILGHETQAEELRALQEEFSAYELYLKCVHNNGIPFELIKKTLPVINEEMNKLLQNIVEFEAYFENEDGKLEIYIKHPKMTPRAIENCSGAEKTLVAMAIRLALIKCGSLPVSDVFILDEPATSLDAEHLDSFINILEMIKSQFKIVLLITHLDTLKDSVDKIIEINKDEEGFAYLN
jgi:DNA repair exonuclease SbcCD ATPase subunit/DNA repair exonuclease SbcCD nuclease subunit